MTLKQRFSFKKNTEGRNAVELSVSYSKGGMNFWNAKKEPRGYWLHATLGEADGYSFCYEPMNDTNFRIFLKDASRLNRAHLQALAEKFLIKEVAAAVYKGDKQAVYGYFKTGDKNVLQPESQLS